MLRGQEVPSRTLLDYRYREKFHLSQKELEGEPNDIYELNMGIMGVETKLYNEAIRRQERMQSRTK